MALRFGISIPQFVADGEFDPRAMSEYLARAEALGFESAWVGEQVFGTMPHLDPIETLTYAAACTETIRLGTAVIISPLRSPAHLAKAISTLDQLSRGRVEFGLATGGSFRPFSAFGIDNAAVVSRFTEGLRYMQALWTQPRVDFDGRFWQVTGAAMEPKPFQKPHPPVWFGGGHPEVVRRAVQLADGLIGAGSSTTEDFATIARTAREQLERNHRDSASFRLAKRVYLGVDDDGTRARQRVADALGQLYGYFGLRDVDRCAVAGTSEEVAAGLQVVADAGAELIVLNPLYDDAEQLERLTLEVLPAMQ